MNFFKKRRIKKNWRDHEIDPEDILLDAANIPSFDEDKFEGRLEKPISKTSLYFLPILFLIIGIIFGGRLYYIQIAKGDEYKNWSEENRLRREPIFAHRGTISDREGVLLAWNEGESGAGTSSAQLVRKYKDVPGIAHTIGYVSSPKKDSNGNYYQDKFIGQSGAEESFDEILSGENGIRLYEENARLEIESRSVIVPPEHGENLSLSIDSRLNQILFEEIRKFSEEVGFTGGAGVVMDVSTGEVVAMTSFPEFSPEVMAEGEDTDAIEGFLEDRRNPFLNRAVSGLYTPGSTVKPYVAIKALEEGIISPEKEILSTGRLVVPNPFVPSKPTIFRDWKEHGWLDMRDALAWSSNVYFFHIGGGFEDQKGIGISGIENIMQRFGFGDKTGIELAGESDGTIPTPLWKEETFGTSWRIGDTYNTSIGQFGFQVTVLQLARSVAAIANNGKLLTPTILKDKIPEHKDISVSKSALEVVREGMRGGALYGTGRALNVPYTDFAVKTGTAELGVAKEDVNSWISGYFPYESPKYAFAMVMERGSRSNTVGASSAARRFFDRLNAEVPEFFDEK